MKRVGTEVLVFPVGTGREGGDLRIVGVGTAQIRLHGRFRPCTVASYRSRRPDVSVPCQ